MKKQLITLSIILLMFSIGFSGCFEEAITPKPTTIHVDDDGDGDYTSIQAAIDNAIDGSTIFVYSGLYNENITISKKLKLIGIENELDEGNDTGIPTINFYDVSYESISVVEILANECEFSGFNITSSKYLKSNDSPFYIEIEHLSGLPRYMPDGIKITSDKNIISNNKISVNGTGVKLDESELNTIFDNVFVRSDYGIDIHSSSNNSIFNNLFQENSGGINIFDSFNCSIYNNDFMLNGINFEGNTIQDYTHKIENNIVNSKPIYYYKNKNNQVIPDDAGQVIIVNCSDFKIQNLTISDVYTGILVVFSTATSISGNIIKNNIENGVYLYRSDNIGVFDNLIMNNGGTGIQVESNSYQITIYENNVTSNGGDGISIYGYEDYNTILNNVITYNNGNAIEIQYSGRNTVSGNYIKDNDKGIYLDDSSGNSILNNIFFNNSIDIPCSFFDDCICNQESIENNTANGKPIYYYKNMKNQVVPTDAGQVLLYNCENMTLTNLDISNVDAGLIISFSSDNMISNSDIINCGYGIKIGRSLNNKFVNNLISDCENTGILVSEYSNNNNFTLNQILNNGGTGIYSYDSSNLIIRNNQIINNGREGIRLLDSPDGIIILNNIENNEMEGVDLVGDTIRCLISKNIIKNNSLNGISLSDQNIVDNNTIRDNTPDGIDIYMASNNTVTNNTIINNIDGISLAWESTNNIIHSNILQNNFVGIKTYENSDNNKIYYNDLIENNQSASDECNNIWYNSVLMEGNYWSDYSGIDANGDGIGDTPYEIPGLDGYQYDNYPLINPVNI